MSLRRIVGIFLVWSIAVVIGLYFLTKYEYTPGPQANTLERWPEGSKIPRDEKLYTLVMFAHPCCPCSVASVEELAIVMPECKGRLTAIVEFYVPDGRDTDWVGSELCSSASAIPGVIVRIDEAGAEAAKFHAESSGFSVLYDPQGNLVFSGGITSSRGHRGENVGRTAVIDVVQGNSPEVRNTPVFGCEICNPNLNTIQRDSAWMK